MTGLARSEGDPREVHEVTFFDSNGGGSGVTTNRPLPTTVDPATAALAAEVLAIASRAHTATVAAVGAYATGETSAAQAALDRVARLISTTLEQRQRHVSVRALSAAIEGRLPDLPISVGVERDDPRNGLVIPADPAQPCRSMDWSQDDHLLDVLYTTIDCDFVETVDVDLPGVDRLVMWVDEDGLVADPGGVNARAAQLLDATGRRRSQDVVRDVVITGVADDAGETLGLTDAQRDAVLSLLGGVVA